MTGKKQMSSFYHFPRSGTSKMIWTILMWILLVNYKTVAPGRVYQHFIARKLSGSVLYSQTTDQSSTCSCRLACAMAPECTAFSIVDQEDGKFSCLYSRNTVLNWENTEQNASAITFIKHDALDDEPTDGEEREESGVSTLFSSETASSSSESPVSTSTTVTPMTTGSDITENATESATTNEESTVSTSTTVTPITTGSDITDTSTESTRTTTTSSTTNGESTVSTSTTVTPITTGSDITDTESTSTTTTSATTNEVSTSTTVTPITTGCDRYVTYTESTGTTTTSASTNKMCDHPFSIWPCIGCFYVSNEGSTWQESERHCENRNSSLYVAKSEEKFHALRCFLNRAKANADILPSMESFRNVDIFIGIKGRQWTDGRNVTVEEWADTQPNDDQTACGRMSHHLEYKIADSPCSGRHLYLCEKELTIAFADSCTANGP